MQGVILARQEINYKSNRNVFTFHKDNQDCFQCIITKGNVYFKGLTGQNLPVEVMINVVDFMVCLSKENTANREVLKND